MHCPPRCISRTAVSRGADPNMGGAGFGGADPNMGGNPNGGANDDGVVDADFKEV